MKRRDIEKMEREVQSILSKKRFKHSKLTAEMARELALEHGIDPEQAYLAGILHDCCREWPKKELLAHAKENGLIRESWEETMPDLFHGPLGAIVARERFGVSDGKILDAIAHHTLGRPGMGELEKIIYLADKLEPSRKYDGVEILREISRQDLDAALLQSLEQTLKFVLKKGQFLHPLSVAARNDLVLKRDR